MANINDLVNGGYVTIFDRGADPQGAAFWIGTTGRAPNDPVTPPTATTPGDIVLIDTLGANMFNTTAGGQAFNALYPPNMSPTDFITALYQHLGNSVPDAGGLSFWQAQLAAKTGPNARAEIAAEVSFVLQVFDPTAASFLALTPEQQQAAIKRAATYQNKIAVSEALAATGNSVFNPTAFNDATYKAEQALLSSVDDTAASRQAALDRVAAANAANNPALLVGGALTITLTPGIDTPPAYQTSLDNVVFFAPDVLQAGVTVPTLNPGDVLVDTGKNGTLKVISGGGENLTGWTSTGIPNIDLSNSNQLKFGGTTLSASGATGLTKVLTHDNFAAVTVTNVPNLVELDVSGPTKGVTLNYASAVTGVQDLGLNNVSQTVGGITFGTNAPSKIAVHLTGDNTVLGITDTKLTDLKVNSTDAGHTSDLGLITPGTNTLANADFSGVDGHLKAVFADNSFLNGSKIALGNHDTITVGHSTTAGHTTDVVNINGSGGIYNLTLGNQNDVVTLGAHSVTDTLTFHDPNAGAITVVHDLNLGVDQLQFATGTFTGSHTLLQAGGAASASAIAAPQTANMYSYQPGGPFTMTAGQNFILDKFAGDTTTAAVTTNVNVTNPITYGAQGGFSVFPSGSFLLAYSPAPNDVNIAEVTVPSFFHFLPSAEITSNGGGSTVHDIIHLTGVSLTSLTAANVSFIA